MHKIRLIFYNYLISDRQGVKILASQPESLSHKRLPATNYPHRRSHIPPRAIANPPRGDCKVLEKIVG